jgi:hypothetical protein
MQNPKRPGLHDGVMTEFTVMAPVKQGHEKAIRDTITQMVANPRRREAVNQIGTLHEARYVLFDNDTRLMFCSSFDGSWDQYIDDFATTYIADIFDAVFSHCEGFPGVKSPGVKDWFMKYTHEADAYISAYPNATVRDIWKALKVQGAFQDLLDQAAA